MITKEQIEGWYMITDDYHTPAMAQEFKRLALLALSMEPRPLAEIEGPAIRAHKVPGNTGYTILCKYADGEWRGSWAGTEWPDTTLAIPLSALAGLMEGK